ncbi:hypothetical protein PTTG_03195 [Puccinia triticina 1-1 BBBD Race 1]|uniref:Yeast cell wall synthesis Kre9/Knh1-like N-terminal domain-containing protein n=1 Tax=Puccinia triticina (isolate 1-1 / race 1 (BBBD)) TaxID=630390 RepID=A0A180H063_PUCT1|nr:hypothetical protein PTTG_03195 [Puccinia triticina 1-1 BBBD Race 1]
MVQNRYLMGLNYSLPLMVVFLLGVILPFRSADAYLITSPATNDFWYMGNKKSLTWSSVNSDPATFSVAITNQDPSTYPTALSTLVVKGLPKRLGRYDIPPSAIKGLKEGSGYQINIMSPEGGAILAQSPTFTISREDDESGDGGADDDEAQVFNYADHQEEARTTTIHHHHGALKANKGKDNMYRYRRLGKTHPKSHRHNQARPYRSRQRFQKAKAKSNTLYNSIPKFDHSRGACSRSPRNPRVAKVVRI